MITILMILQEPRVEGDLDSLSFILMQVCQCEIYKNETF